MTTVSFAADLGTAKTEWSRKLLPVGFGASAAVHPAAENVVGVGIGRKTSAGQPTNDLVLKFFVRQKFSRGVLSASEALPSRIDGIDTDIEEVGVIEKHSGGFDHLPNPRLKLRPAQPGCSVGFPHNTVKMAGTLGAIVSNGNRLFVLSNNHVLADENRLPLGRQTLQPGPLDGGVASSDTIGVLARFEPIVDTALNRMDAALSAIEEESMIHPSSLHIGQISRSDEAALDMEVHKFGRTTGYTVGRITSVSTDVKVAYETGFFVFEEQILIRGLGASFSAPGDSGSLILTRDENIAVGLLFAGSMNVTVANHLGPILDHFGIYLVS